MSVTNDRAVTRRFLLTRGICLVVVEFSVVNFGIWFDPHVDVLIFEVIAAIGVGFLGLSVLLRLPPWTIGLIGGLIVVFQASVALIAVPENGLFKGLTALFSPLAFPYATGKLLLIGYPPVPWLGVMLLGYGAGPVFAATETDQRRLFRTLGLLSLGVFVCLRAVNGYGDAVPWSVQPSGLYTVLSFLNVSKYPPSLQFCLLFLGIMFLILSRLPGLKTGWTALVGVYGKTPLFYFLVHWYVIHPFVFVMVFLQGFKRSDLVFGSNFGRPKTGSGLELGAVYLIWVLVVLLMYPLCQWYGHYKARHKEHAWLRYI